MWLVYIPVFFYYLYLSLKSGSYFFFTATNPGIENGGMLGESKFDILNRIAAKPKTILIKAGTDTDQICNILLEKKFIFPLIFKPDIGERGWGVQKIKSRKDISRYINQFKVNFIVQDYVDLPLEAGVFYYRFPGEKRGTISSITIKEMLTVTGDGKSTLHDLILAKDRARLQYDVLKEKFKGELSNIPEKDKSIELVSIGNHCLGTTFLDGNRYIDDQMTASFDKLSEELTGFYYGRFDLRCESVAHLKAGDVKIIELNGTGAEPSHVYQPGFSLFKAWRVLLHHFNVMYKIARQNNKTGIKYMGFRKGVNEIRKIIRYNKINK